MTKKELEKSRMAELMDGLTGGDMASEALVAPMGYSYHAPSRPQRAERGQQEQHPKRKPTTTVTTILDTDLVDKVRIVSMVENVPIKEIITFGLEYFMKLYEEKKGPVTGDYESMMKKRSVKDIL